MSELSITKQTIKANINIYLVSIIAFLYWMAQYLYVPILPLLVRSKTDNLELIGLSLSVYGLGHLVIRIPAGLGVSRFGRNKPFIAVGLVIVAIGVLVMRFSEDATNLMIGRGISGIAAGTWVPLVLLFNKSFTSKNPVKATVMVTFMSAVARLAGSTFSTLLYRRGGFYLPFMVSAALAILAILLLIPIKEKTLPSEKITLKGYLSVISKKEVINPTILGMLAQHVNWGLTFGFLPILAKSIGISDGRVAFITTVFFIFFLAGSLITTFISKSINLNLLSLIGFFSMIIGMGIAVLSKDIAMIFVSQAFIGIAIGICEPLLMGMSIQKLPAEDQSNAMGFHQTIYAIGMFSGPFLSGILADYFGIQSMILITMALTLISLLLIFKNEFLNIFGKRREEKFIEYAINKEYE